MAPRIFARKVTRLEKQAGATARLAIAFLSATLGLVPLPSRAATVRVDNPSGSVFARVANVKEVRVRHSSPKRKVRPADTQITRQMGGEVVLVNCRPSDGAPIQVTIDIPYGSKLDVRTRDADIAINGLIARANLTTDSGDIRLTVPWAAMRLSIDSEQKPQHYQGPEGYEFTESKRFSRAGETWHLQDDLGFGKITFGSILVKAKSPGQIVLKDAPIPHDSPVKLPWQAPAILDELLGLQEPSERADAAAGPRRSGSAGGEPGEVLFTSDVRLVNLMVSVTGRVGVRGLRKEDFEILEDGERQEIDSISSDEVPFNLVLLLDWSGSTENDREAMLEAVRGFVKIARPQDRVAVYVMVGNMFWVASPLTSDQKDLLKRIRGIPELPGGSPLYDSIVLAYAQELRQRRGERNALLVISDGLDNQIRKSGSDDSDRVASSMGGLPSIVPFRRLTLAVTGMETLVYPIFLDPLQSGSHSPEEWSRVARRRQEELAERTGGLLFRARSIQDLDPVYPRIAEELRSVHSLGYYPKNQNFDGAWRKVRVKVRRPGTDVRTRGGYFAR